MKSKIVLVLMLAVLASCATAYKNEGDPGGKEAYVIECEQQTGKCFEKANKVCPNGYITTKVSAVAATSLLLFPAQLRTLEVTCK